MTCSECWSSVPKGKAICPRCGAKVTGAPPSFRGLLRAYPWLGVVLGLSVLITLWAVTRRAPPPPEAIPPAVEPAVEAPAPAAAPEPDDAPMPMPVVPGPSAAPVAPAARPAAQTNEPLRQSSNGAWSGRVLADPSGR
jgi:hypothetical protein